MDGHFVVIINKHKGFGYVASPFLIRQKIDKEFFLVEERITPLNIKHTNYTPFQQKIIQKCDEMSDLSTVKIFDKKKKGFIAFFNNLSQEYIETHIIPYIERRMVIILDLVREHKIPLYFISKHDKTLFDEDRLIISEEPAEVIFNFIKTEESFRYHLSISHQEKEIGLTGFSSKILVNNPCYLILENHLYHFTDIDGKKLKPFFKKEHIVIPKLSEKKYFETFVLNSLRKYKVKTSGFVYEQTHPNPLGILSLAHNLKSTPIFILKFRYDAKLIFHRNDLMPGKTSMKEEDGTFSFHKISRNIEEENNIALWLTNMGLLEAQLGQFILAEDEPDKSNIYKFINWLIENKEKLERNNISIEQKQIEKKFSLHEVELTFEVKNKIDWFDINARVICGDYSFPFLEFKQYILNGIREFPLPNGEFLILPNDWFEKYDDFFFHVKETADGMQLNRQYIGVLRKAYVGSSSSYLKKIKDLGKLFTKPKIELPENLNATLRPYQNEGYSWLYFLQQNNFGGCLADDMGLGKTLQTLVLLLKSIKTRGKLRLNNENDTIPIQLNLFDSPAHQKNEEKRNENEYRTLASLIVMPTSLIHNWENEINKFTPSLRVYKYVGAKRATYKSAHKTFYNYDIILTTYGIARNDNEFLRKYKFFYLILDESQYIKNPHSKSYKSIIQLDALHRLTLTGTPIENSLKDFWAQMNFINPGLLGSLEFFNKRYILPIEKGDNIKQQENLQALIKPFILRRTKHEVAHDLPPLTSQSYYVNMTEEQEEYYENEKSRIRNSIIKTIDQKGYKQSTIIILQGLLRLRQLANHPLLIDENYENSSGKFEEVCRIIENLLLKNHKVLVFSGFVTHLNIFAKYFDLNNWKYSKLTGQTKKRKEVIDQFQNDEENHLFLISIKAGGVGLNLTAADYIFILDPWWNPATELQAISRAHRIGQDKNVFVYRFITKNSIEEKIKLLQEKKSDISDMFINSNNPFAKINQKTIMELLE